MRKKHLRSLAAAAIVCLIYTIGCGSTAPDKDQWLTPTFWKSATLEEVKSGIKAGYKPDPTFSNGYTPLLMAAFFNNSPEVIEELIKGGASVNSLKGGMTPLIAAASNNDNVEIVKTLLRHGADVNAKGINGISPLLIAAEKCPNDQVFQVLIDAGANLNDKLDNGASISDLALKNFKAGKKIREIIVSKGNKIDLTSVAAMDEFLHQCSNRGDFARFKEMMVAGIPVDTPSQKGDLPILAVVSAENLDIAKLKLLLENGASPNRSDKYYDPPIIEFVRRVYSQNVFKFYKHFYGNRYDLSDLLKEIGFDEEMAYSKRCSYGGKFALDENPARVNDAFFDVLRLLAHYNADFNVSDGEGNNLLHIAMMAGAESKVIDYFLSHGCKPGSRNKFGDTPYEIMLSKCESLDELKRSLALTKLSIDNATSGGIELGFNLMAKSMTNSVILDFIGAKAVEFVNRNGENLLFAAASNRNTQKETIERLIKAGIDINARNNQHQTPLMYSILAATGSGTVDLLLENGADQSLTDAEQRNILHYHAMNEFATFPDLQKIGVEKINARDKNGETPLITALKHDQKGSVFNFMYADADVFIKDANDKSALDYDDEAWIFEFCKSEKAASQMIERLHLKRTESIALMTPLSIFELKCAWHSKGEKEPNADEAMTTEVMEYMERHKLPSINKTQKNRK
ncbi:MAG: ankyrin repeat domain-containing protein [Candidatus Riflebacteria bacterium]|nr:ankyrin repeat domain-containing protein [Candidatus Riflebacteria bacterium]